LYFYYYHLPINRKAIYRSIAFEQIITITGRKDKYFSTNKALQKIFFYQKALSLFAYN